MRPSLVAFARNTGFNLDEYYAFQATRLLVRDKSKTTIKGVSIATVVQAVFLGGLCTFMQTGTTEFMFVLTFIFMSYLSKITAILFIFIDDIRRLITLFYSGRKRRHKKNK